MGLWLWEDVPPMTFRLADQDTTLAVTLILRGAWDEDLPPAEIIDLSVARAARAARDREAAARRARDAHRPSSARSEP